MKFLILFLSQFFVLSCFAQLDKIVLSIENGASLGFDQNDQFARFSQLNKIAKLEELIELTDHKSPAVRGYSFWALAKRNYSGLEDIFLNHINDTESVLQKNGCMIGKETVISFMKQVVTPYMYDPSCKKLPMTVREMVINN